MYEKNLSPCDEQRSFWQDDNLLVGIGKMETVGAKELSQFTLHQQCTRVVVSDSENFSM